MMMEVITDKVFPKNNESPLYQVGEKVIDFEKESHELVAAMRETIEHYNAYGVAANQIGILKQAFMMRVQGEYHAFFNPEVIELSEDTHVFPEGCLSFPDLYVKIKRSREITLKFQSINGEEHVQKYDGMAARVIQHELDHLAGRRFFDGANRIHLESALRKYKSAKRKK